MSQSWRRSNFQDNARASNPGQLPAAALWLKSAITPRRSSDRVSESVLLFPLRTYESDADVKYCSRSCFVLVILGTT